MPSTMPAPTPFLRLVAQAFVNNYADSLHDICFIFPNRRSGVFFLKELASIVQKPTLSPEVITISDFLCDVTGSVEATKIELLLILYENYRKIAGDGADDFDRFSFWGDIILNDFNDVDKYLAMPDEIFKNVRDFKSIRSNYLTEEQKEVISRYFGENAVQQSDVERFWQDSTVYDGKSTKRFFNIWEILLPLYRSFNDDLAGRGLSYSGKIYRDAVERIKNMGAEEFPHRKYVFVGFNVLSLSEIKIFEYLKLKGIADYYWDCNSPALLDENNKASWFISKNVRMFPPELDLHEPEIKSFSPINVVGIPSNVGQTKYASTIIERLIAEKAIADPSDAINTAIVLPDEGLFLPLLDSVSEKITGVNITMGYPLRMSGIAVFLNLIAKMHKQARKSGDDYAYFHDDLKDLMAHPFAKSIASEEVECVSAYLMQSRAFYVASATLARLAPRLSVIFEPVRDTTSTSEFIDYVARIVGFVEKMLMQGDTISSESVEMGFIAQYMDLFLQLAGTIGKYDIKMNENTFFFLVGRMISSAKIAFEGEPLKGLQIMGVLETRCMDFENLIVLSMNERVFPRKHYSRSFIPNNLRRGFGMATVEFQDCMYAYYFYRMISRAKNIYMLYDARTQSLGSGEHSRYIEQLKTLYPDAEIRHSVASFKITVPKEIEINMPKDKRIMERLDRYRTPGSGAFLSASAINMYINCPLMFYFEKVEDFKIADDVTEFMDASTLGTIVHSVMEQIYSKMSDGCRQKITEARIHRLLAQDDKTIYDTVMRTINSVYFNKENCTDITTGETMLVSDAIIYYVRNILAYDARMGGFTFVQAEKREEIVWTLEEGLSINMRQYIDRVDIAGTGVDGEPSLRIVDYKTGKDKTSAASMEMLFKAESADRRKAMFQLMLYCNIYAQSHKTDEPIRPIIYTVRSIDDSGFTIGRNSVTDYHDVNQDFLNAFVPVIKEMFNNDVPFYQAKNAKHCEYCKFASFCHR